MHRAISETLAHCQDLRDRRLDVPRAAHDRVDNSITPRGVDRIIRVIPTSQSRRDIERNDRLPALERRADRRESSAAALVVGEVGAREQTGSDSRLDVRAHLGSEFRLPRRVKRIVPRDFRRQRDVLAGQLSEVRRQDRVKVGYGLVRREERFHHEREVLPRRAGGDHQVRVYAAVGVGVGAVEEGLRGGPEPVYAELGAVE